MSNKPKQGCGISEFDKKNIEEILHGSGDWFSAYLIRLINKADTQNKEALAEVFPEHVEAHDDYIYGRGYYAQTERES